MQDFKHFNRRRTTFAVKRQTTGSDQFKDLVESRPQRRRLRIILPLLVLLLGLYPLISAALSSRRADSPLPQPAVAPAAKPKPLGKLDGNQCLAVAAEALPACRQEGERLLAPLADGGTIAYGFDAELQGRMQRYLAEMHVPYGAFVALEPKTGRVLALVGHSDLDPAWGSRGCFNVYPMASLFKIVTAAAALEQKKITPETVFPYRGKATSENPKYWSVNPRGRNQQMDLTTAMGKSVNPVYGRLASDVVGRDSLMTCVDHFGFNQQLFPNTPVLASTAPPPADDRALKLMGAGLGREVKISPLHAASMMAGIANGGVMLSPSLAEEVRNGKGELVYQRAPQQLRTLVTPETARQLERLMSTTVKSGTSRKAFRDRRGRRRLGEVTVIAKTGTINGTDPAGHYSWFAAYAPADDPQIALVALVVNGAKWRVKASHVGEQALETYFR